LLCPTGTLGDEYSEVAHRIRLWGQIWIHCFLGAVVMFPVFVLVARFGKWGLFGLVIPLGLPIYREFIHDEHTFSDLWNDTPSGRDCRADAITCLAGSAIGLPFLFFAY